MLRSMLVLRKVWVRIRESVGEGEDYMFRIQVSVRVVIESCQGVLGLSGGVLRLSAIVLGLSGRVLGLKGRVLGLSGRVLGLSGRVLGLLGLSGLGRVFLVSRSVIGVWFWSGLRTVLGFRLVSGVGSV